MKHKVPGSAQAGKRFCNRRVLAALKTQTRPIALRSGATSIDIDPAIAARLILTNCYAWKLREGLVRAVWLKQPDHREWLGARANWRGNDAAVLYPSENYARS